MLNSDQITALRILDASLNRAMEGLRVIEDYLRFGCDDAHLTTLSKAARHDLVTAFEEVPELSTPRLHALRDTQGDVGTPVSTPAEAIRTDLHHVALASFKRLEQSLRSMEEYGKLLNGSFSTAMEQLRYRVYTLEKAVTALKKGQERLADCRLYLLLSGRDSLDSFTSFAEQLIASGADVIQLRDKDLSDSDLTARASRLVELTRCTSTLAIINDRPDIARIAGADGVHVGQEELSVSDVRQIVGPDMLVGVSTHTIKQARQAVLDGADYLGCGPTFPSSTKCFSEFPGLDYLKEVADEVSLPLFAIGGITLDSLPEVLATGIERVAIAGAITKAEDPAAACRAFTERLTKIENADEHR